MIITANIWKVKKKALFVSFFLPFFKLLHGV